MKRKKLHKIAYKKEDYMKFLRKKHYIKLLRNLHEYLEFPSVQQHLSSQVAMVDRLFEPIELVAVERLHHDIGIQLPDLKKHNFN